MVLLRERRLIYTSLFKGEGGRGMGYLPCRNEDKRRRE